MPVSDIAEFQVEVIYLRGVKGVVLILQNSSHMHRQ